MCSHRPPARSPGANPGSPAHVGLSKPKAEALAAATGSVNQHTKRQKELTGPTQATMHPSRKSAQVYARQS
eukprot:scaffold1702_cov391-Prasinococcus_capsulatus_cf.AAC.4